MNFAFDALGLPPDADERAIKRAYAAKLRATRPDEDPEGFQRLYDAYREALADAQRRHASRHDDDDDDDRMAAAMEASGRGVATSDEGDGHAPGPSQGDPAIPSPPSMQEDTDPQTRAPETTLDGPAHPRMPGPPTEPPSMPRFALEDGTREAADETPPFDVEACLDQIELKIHDTYPQDFEQWLARHPTFGDPRIRRSVSLPMLEFLSSRPTLPRGHVEALWTFFDLGRFDPDRFDPDRSELRTAEAPDDGFDVDAFFEALEIQIHRTRPERFKAWLEQHPALYAIELKRQLAAPTLSFLERRPTLPNGHAEALLQFFGLDKVDGQYPRLQERVQALLYRMRSRTGATPPNADARRPREDGGSIPIWPIIMLVYLLSKCAGGMH